MSQAAVNRTPIALRVFAVPLVLVILLGGLWLFAGMLAPDYTSSMIVGVVWFVGAGLALGKLVKPRPDLRWPVRTTVLVAGAVAAGWVIYTSVTDEKVDERLVVAEPAPRATPAHGGNAPAPPARRAKPAPPRNQVVA